MMRIVIITKGISPIVIPLIDTGKVVGIVEARPRQTIEFQKYWNKKTTQRSLSDYIHFVKVKSRQMLSTKLERCCIKHSIPYRYMSDGCSESLEQWIRHLTPDLICVYSMSELLRENLFTIPPLGTINLHPSLLPKFRGPNPYIWVLLNEEKESGTTIHYIDKGEDTGDILAQEAFVLDNDMTISELRLRAIALGIRLMLRVIDDIYRGTASPIKQPQESPTHRARNVKSGEFYDLIQWSEWSVERIGRLFKRSAFSLIDVFPYKTSLCWKKWQLSQITRSEQTECIPGTILITSRSCTLYCIDGTIRFTGHVSLRQIARKLIGKIS